MAKCCSLVDLTEMVRKANPYYQIGNTVYAPRRKDVRPSDDDGRASELVKSYHTLCTGFSLLFLTLFDGTTLFNPLGAKSTLGRLKALAVTPVCDLSAMFTEMDALRGILVELMCEYPYFKDTSILSHRLNLWKVSTPLTRGVKGVLVGWARHCPEDREGQAYLLRWLNTVAMWFAKTNIDRPDLEQEALEKYYGFEERLRDEGSHSEFSPQVQCLLRRCNILLKSVTNTKVRGPMLPCHGPGAVAEDNVGTRQEKYEIMVFPYAVQRLLHRQHDDISNYICGPTPPFAVVQVPSVYMDVPKNWKSRRALCKEPTGLQYWQHAVRQVIIDELSHNMWWRRRVNLSRQDLSRDLCIKGSLTTDYATIDISSASDSVLLRHVEEVFRDTEWLDWLLAVRSPSIRVGDVTIVPLKYAGMGSACTFPVETIIFTLVAELAIRDSAMTRAECAMHCRVYGDDIIIPWFAVKTLYRYLEMLGFIVNKEKSYTSGYFREACGVEAWFGKEVTPVKYRGPFLWTWPKSTLCGEEHKRVVDFVNSLEMLGAHHASRGLLKVYGELPVFNLRRLGQGWRTFVFSSDYAEIEYRKVWTPTLETNFRLKRLDWPLLSSWPPKTKGSLKIDGFSNYQRQSYEVISFEKRTKGWRDSSSVYTADSIAYLEWSLRRQHECYACTRYSEALHREVLVESNGHDEYRDLAIDEIMVPVTRRQWV